ncbi:MAG: hypothetical protein WBZ33_07630, partial [Thermoactinomyces sp.]
TARSVKRGCPFISPAVVQQNDKQSQKTAWIESDPSCFYFPKGTKKLLALLRRGNRLTEAKKKSPDQAGTILRADWVKLNLLDIKTGVF